MQSSGSLSNIGMLSLGKELGKPRSLVLPRGMERSWSSPALAAAFGLRKYAVQMKHHPGERVPRASAGDQLEIPIEKIDLIGGNGHHRQMKAEEEFKRRRLEEEEQRRQDLLKAAAKKKKALDREDRRKKFQEEEERRWQEEREQKRRDAIEKEEQRLKEEEKARLAAEVKTEEKRKRMPRTCETCDGTCKCQECMGKGYVFSIFLVSSKSDDQKDMEHGRVYQGCDKCGGYSHNMLGELKKGTGQCAGCQGLGKIWPVIEDMPASPKGVITKSTTQFMSERFSEVKLT